MSESPRTQWLVPSARPAELVDIQAELGGGGRGTVQNTQAMPALKPKGLPLSFPNPPTAGSSAAPHSSQRLDEDRRKPKNKAGNKSLPARDSALAQPVFFPSLKEKKIHNG